MIEILDYLLRLKHDMKVRLNTDSVCVLEAMQGFSVPATHQRLIELLIQMWEKAKHELKITAVKVAAHVGVPGDERADALAEK